MGWSNPRWGSLVGPDAEALRAIFESLAQWTNDPKFGYATNPTTAAGGNVIVPPTSLRVRAEWIESNNFDDTLVGTNRVGWRIKANGDAEFNNVVTRGVFKTAETGRRVEIGTAGDVASVKFFTGAAGETAPAILRTQFASGTERMAIIPARFSGGTNTTAINIADWGTSITNGLSVTDSGATGIRWALAAIGPNALEINGHARMVGSGNVFDLTVNTLKLGDVGFGWASILDIHGWIRLAAGSRLQVQNTDHTIFGEGIITTGNTAGIRIGQRSRGANDATHSYALYGNADAFNIYHNTAGDRMRFTQVGSFLDLKIFNIPNLVGDNLSLTGTWQVGYQASTQDIKRNIRHVEAPSPVFKMSPRRFLWDEAKVANAEEINNLFPGGQAGLIAEEVQAVAPDAVTLDEHGKPRGLNMLVMQGYLVQAIKELKRDVVALEEFTKIVKKT